jgi:hypothetical protein
VQSHAICSPLRCQRYMVLSHVVLSERILYAWLDLTGGSLPHLLLV